MSCILASPCKQVYGNQSIWHILKCKWKKYISKLVYLLQGKSQVYLKYDEVQEVINSKVACIELSKNTGIVLQNSVWK